MNLAELNLDVETESKEVSDFSPLPEGTYVCVVTEAEIRDTKAGDGKLLTICCQVIEGDYNERFFYEHLNIVNKNPTAEKIGRAKLAALCKAVGISNPQEVEELHDKPFSAKVVIDTKGERPRNVIKSFAAVDVELKPSTPAPAAPKPATASKPAPSAGKKPWQK